MDSASTQATPVTVDTKTDVVVPTKLFSSYKEPRTLISPATSKSVVA
jgi:hypothetical protein